MLNKFDEANTQVVGLSVDSRFALNTWAAALGGIRYPLAADFWPHGGVASAYGILNEDAGIASRSLFIIDPEGVIRHAEQYPPGTLPDPQDVLAALGRLQG